MKESSGSDLSNARIAVVRTEHLEQDWASIETVSLRQKEASRFSFLQKNKSFKSKDDRYLSDVAQRNLCDGLCEEIQIYKLMLNRAENLSAEDVATTMTELRGYCPKEADRETCPERPDFGVQKEDAETAEQQ